MTKYRASRSFLKLSSIMLLAGLLLSSISAGGASQAVAQEPTPEPPPAAVPPRQDAQLEPLQAEAPAAQSQAGPLQAEGGPEVIWATGPSLSEPLTVIAQREGPAQLQAEGEINPPGSRLPPEVLGGAPEGDFDESIVQTAAVGNSMPSTVANFEGAPSVGSYPPDTNGDIGHDGATKYYMQWVNVTYAIWDVTIPGAPNLLVGPSAGNTLWNSFGGICETNNDGDPIVVFDHLNNRWLASQFAYSSNNNHQCIAVSTTANPTGTWNRYDFLWSTVKFNDYPKFGVWPDGYYMSVNQFNNAGTVWLGAGVAAFDGEAMRNGDPASMQKFDVGAVTTIYGGMLPSDLDGPAPAAGTPNYFVEWDDSTWISPFLNDALRIWEFHVDWATPGNSTFGLAGFAPNQTITTTNVNPEVCFQFARNCIPQPGTAVKLDALSDRLMYRLQYRDFGTYKALVSNHTVDTGGDHAGIHWFELQDTGSGWGMHQQAVYSPDTDHRWMGSIAMDGDGDMALGYSVSSSSTYPSIRYTGRLFADSLNQLPQGEAILQTGSGSQLGTAYRWGDYSMMSVDPMDDCTFWYTNEYYLTTSNVGWRTRIGSFAFPSCTGTTYWSISGNAGTPFATMTYAPGGSAAADGSGNYVINVPDGWTGTVTPSRTQYSFAPPSRSYTNVTADDPGENYVATLLPPANDDFDNATVIGALPYTEGGLNTTSATQNGDDPIYGCTGAKHFNTVWYKYTPAANGFVSADTFTSSYDTVLGVWTGARPSLVSTACDDDTSGTRSRVQFAVSSGTTYYIEAASKSAGGGTLVLHVNPSSGPTDWLTRAPMSVGRSRLAAAAALGKIYVIGGESAAGAGPAKPIPHPNRVDGGPAAYETSIEAYDPFSDSWSAGAAKPTGVSNIAAAVINNKIYVPGGYNGFSVVSVLEAYDPLADTWSSLAPMPVAQYGSAVAAIGHKLYVMGGEDDFGTLNTCRVYDADLNSWGTCGTMNYARWYPAAGVVNGKIYVVGGYPDLDVVEEFTPPSTWTIKAPMSTPRGGPGAVGYGSRLYVCGGGWTSYLDTCEKYDPGSDTWSDFEHLNTGRRTLGMAALNGRLYAEGGWAGSYQAVNEELTIDPTLAPPTIIRFYPLDFSTACRRPQVGVKLGLSNMVRDGNGSFDPSTVTLKLDNIDRTSAAKITQSLAYPVNEATIVYTPPSNLSVGMHSATFTYPSPGGPITEYWGFTLSSITCPTSAQLQAPTSPDRLPSITTGLSAGGGTGGTINAPLVTATVTPGALQSLPHPGLFGKLLGKAH